MTITTDTKTAAAISSRKLPATKQTSTSKDGKWRTFHKHAGLMQYVPSGVFFARAKVAGIVKRASLETDVFTVAQDRLRAKKKELQKTPEPDAPAVTFKDAKTLYLADIENDHALAPETKRYWNYRVAALLKSWPGLDGVKLDKITVPQCRAWGHRFAEKFEAVNFNNTLAALQNILKRGGLRHFGFSPQATMLVVRAELNQRRLFARDESRWCRIGRAQPNGCNLIFGVKSSASISPAVRAA